MLSVDSPGVHMTGWYSHGVNGWYLLFRGGLSHGRINFQKKKKVEKRFTGPATLLTWAIFWYDRLINISLVHHFGKTCHYLPSEPEPEPSRDAEIALLLHVAATTVSMHASRVLSRDAHCVGKLRGPHAQLLAARWQKKDKINWIRYIGCQKPSPSERDEMGWKFHTCCLHDKFCLK